MKNIRLKSGITFSFIWKRSRYSVARVLTIYFNVFISKCDGLALAYENLAPLSAKKMPTLTSPIVPQLALRNLPVQLRVNVKAKITWGTCDNFFEFFWTGNFETFSYAEAKPLYMDSEMLKSKIWTLAPESCDHFHLAENLLPDFRRTFFMRTNHLWWPANFSLIGQQRPIRRSTKIRLDYIRLHNFLFPVQYAGNAECFPCGKRAAILRRYAAL